MSLKYSPVKEGGGRPPSLWLRKHKISTTVCGRANEGFRDGSGKHSPTRNGARKGSNPGRDDFNGGRNTKDPTIEGDYTDGQISTRKRIWRTAKKEPHRNRLKVSPMGISSKATDEEVRGRRGEGDADSQRKRFS